MRFQTLILSLVFYRICTGAIFGEDKRYYNTVPDGALAAIGRINGCAGTLIDKDLVLTALHCVMDLKTKVPFEVSAVRSFVFEPALFGGTSEDPTEVEHIHWLSGPNRGGDNPEKDKDSDQDWAILQLKDPVGNKYGWMEIKPFIDQLAYPTEVLAQDFTSAGYPSDRDGGNTLSVEDKCHLYQENWKERFQTGGAELFFFPTLLLKAEKMHSILNDCAALPGSSGSPIFRMERDARVGKERPVIYAMQVAQLDSKKYPTFTWAKANFAAATGTYYVKYKFIKSNPEERTKPTPILFGRDGYPSNLPPDLFAELTKDIPAKVTASAHPMDETEHPWLQSLRKAREKKSALTSNRASDEK